MQAKEIDMEEPARTPQETQDQPSLTEEMKVEAQPLSVAEKKLIGFSLGLGAFLLVVLILVTGAYRF